MSCNRGGTYFWLQKSVNFKNEMLEKIVFMPAFSVEQLQDKATAEAWFDELIKRMAIGRRTRVAVDDT